MRDSAKTLLRKENKQEAIWLPWQSLFFLY